MTTFIFDWKSEPHFRSRSCGCSANCTATTQARSGACRLHHRR